MKTFSQRKGLKPVSEALQTESASEALRNGLWNVISGEFLYLQAMKLDDFTYVLWDTFWKKPVDSIPVEYNSWDGRAIWTKPVAQIRSYFFACPWNEVYDFLEFLARFADKRYGFHGFAPAVNRVLERELAGYRLVGTVVTDVVGQEEVAMLEKATADSAYSGVTAHLRRSLELLSDRKAPDYRNSIKESISAVEAMAKIVVGKDNASLGDALKVLGKKGHINPRLQQGFEQLYAYTNDKESGIRHAMLEEKELSVAEARFFLLSCTSFVNYLKSKI